jgi:MFS family permease
MIFRGYSSTYFILCVIALLAMISTSLLNPLLSIFAKQIGATGAFIGLVVAGYWISRIVLEIPSGFISSRFGYYTPMFLGLLFTVVGTLLCAFVSDPVQLLLGRALTGVGAPLFFAVSMTFIVELFDTSRRGSAMGVFQGIEFAGSIVGSAFSGFVISALNFSASFILSGLIVGVSTLMMFAPGLRRESRAHNPPKSFSLSEMKGVFGNANLLIVSSATFAEYVLTNGVLITVFPLYASEQLGISLTDIGILMGVRSIGFVVAILMMGIVADKAGRRPVLLFGVGATAALVLVMGYSSSFAALSILIFAIGITTGAIWIVSPVLAAEAVHPSQRGAAIGTYRTFFDLGSILGPIIMSVVQQTSGTAVCFFLASALLFANLVPTLKIRESR